MGQKQSAHSELEKSLEKLTEAERQKLLELFESGKESGIPIHDETYYKILETHLQKFFSPSITGSLVSEFRKHCDESGEKIEVKDRILLEIIHVTHGYTQGTVEFVLHSLVDKTKKIPFNSLKLFIGDVLDCFRRSHASGAILGVSPSGCVRFSKALFASDASKLEYDDLLKNFTNFPVAFEMCQAIIKYVFYETSLTASKEMQGFMPVLVPELELSPKLSFSPENTVLDLSDLMYINSFLPLSKQNKWRFLYSSNLQGESFSKLSTLVLHQGPLLLVVRDQDGHIFGGYISTNLECSSQFQGDSNCFLFRLSPSCGIYSSTGYNNHFVYMNMGQETIPNGLAMGGQHNYFGLWLSTEFGQGHSKGKPTSTTYGNPQLSAKDEFLIDVVEAWGIGNEPKADEDEEDESGGNSVIDKNPDVVAILRIAGKEPASEGYRESERTSTQPEISDLHPAHNPMN